MLGGGATILILSAALFSGYCDVQNVRDLKDKIDYALRVEMIKKNIMSHIGKLNHTGTRASPGGWNVGQSGRDGARKNIPPIPGIPGISPGWQSTPPMPVRPAPAPKKLVVLGEPSSSARDGCFNFAMSRVIKKTVTPIKMDLWVHMTKQARKKKSRRKSRQTNKRNRRRREKSRRRKNKKSKKKRKGKGKRIKLSVSNGKKRLSQLRMRVSSSNWYDISLPISPFEEGVSPSDTFKLCISCKRCKKKIKLDLYDKVDNITDKHIPFIHIQPMSHLPHTRLRSKRSSKSNFQNGVARSPPLQDKNSGAARTVLAPPLCCKASIHTEDVGIPYLLHPTKFNVSVCETIDTSDNAVEQPSTNSLKYLLLKDSSKAIQRQCVAASFDSFTYSFIDSDLKIRYASIPNLLPRGCKCVEV